ncbi:hypothetical protein [Collimonas pratensis]|uniref:hypothetical protein n=1 Tax=Collimonas pratensis TaxID=279113 RepID=UPI0012E91AD1|nr:hypothetical protein [Collimonas pratensis]
MDNQPASSLLSFLPIILMSFSMGIAAHFLAKDKERNVTKWTILGCIPLVNFVCFWFFVGASNLRLERKVDELIAKLDASRNQEVR